MYPLRILERFRAPYCTKRKNYMNGMNWAVGIVVALVVIGGGAYLLSMNHHDAMMMEKEGMMHTDAMMPSQNGVMVGGALMTADRDIVANAMNANNVTTVVAAVSAAGLVETLKGEGPFTVFAPNNAAFDKLPAGTVDTLLKPENKAMLVDILTYHVVAGRYTSADLKDGMTLTTVEGKTLKISKVNGVIRINGAATVETPDVISSNGVTFVIDTVLMPK